MWEIRRSSAAKKSVLRNFLGKEGVALEVAVGCCNTQTHNLTPTPSLLRKTENNPFSGSMRFFSPISSHPTGLPIRKPYHSHKFPVLNKLPVSSRF